MQERKIQSPESYKKSRERSFRLSELVQDGERAKLILDFANEILEQAKSEVIEGLSKKDANTLELHGYWRGMVAFHNKVKTVIAIGEVKRKSLEELKKES